MAALTDTKPSGWALDIYVSDELYADIIASEPATGIEIALTDPAMNAQVEAALRTHFAGAEYAVTNRQSGADFLREMSSGVYLLLGYIFAALFLLILLILYVRLCDYIEGSRPLIRTFTGWARQSGRCTAPISGRTGSQPPLPLPRRS